MSHYNVIRNENIRPFDVDGTLIVNPTKENSDLKSIDIHDIVYNRMITMRVHAPMVRLLREELSRGSYVVVWSRSGYEWAEAVISALGIPPSDRLQIMSKPLVYFDDVDVQDWLKDRVYLTPDTVYKR